MQSAQTIPDGGIGLKEKFILTRKGTVELCEPLETEDYLPQPIEDVSPVKWNIAHTTWFFEEMILKDHLSGYKVFDPSFGFLFNSYYNTVGERTQRHKRGDLSRPTVAQVFEYRAYVDKAMDEFFDSNPDEMAGALIELGINHEQQHQELLLADLKFTLSVNPFDPVYLNGFIPAENGAKYEYGCNRFDEGVYEIGFDGTGFCFDNELSRHKVYLNEFSIDKSLVTNEQFIEFIEDGGYSDHRFWHSEGWDWVNSQSVSAPLYWQREKEGVFSSFTFSGRRPVLPTSPVCHVSYYEAAAFAEWKGRRLPTEFEWEAANSSFDWGYRWEWTSSAYLPYPGFSIADGAVGEYNGKFMVNQKVLRGASAVTPKGHSRASYRNFFHPHLRWQFTGIRLAD